MCRFLIAATVSVLASSIAVAQTESTVVRLDSALDPLVSPGAKVELVKGGFGFTVPAPCPRSRVDLPPSLIALCRLRIPMKPATVPI